MLGLGVGSDTRGSSKNLQPGRYFLLLHYSWKTKVNPHSVLHAELDGCKAMQFQYASHSDQPCLLLSSPPTLLAWANKNLQQVRVNLHARVQASS